MSLAEGTGTDDIKQSPQESIIENKMEETIELHQQQSPNNILPPQYAQQPETQIVVVPNNSIQQTQQTTNYASSNNKVTASVGVHGSMLMTNIGYFRSRDDTKDYDENMTPWEVDGQNYSFACCTRYIVEIGQKQSKKSSQQNEFKWIHTVYHKTGSKRLIIKKKDATSQLEKAKNNPMTKWAILIAILGLLLAAIGGIAGVIYLIAAGVIMIIAALILVCCFSKNKIQVNDTAILLQAIPIKSISYVERTVKKKTQQDQCCCAAPEENGVQYSEISIGYNRSNLSTKLQSGASKEDFIQISLISNQAYNLQQYLNAIIDGSHPQTNGDNDDVNDDVNDQLLPRSSAYQQ